MNLSRYLDLSPYPGNGTTTKGAIISKGSLKEADDFFQSCIKVPRGETH